MQYALHYLIRVVTAFVNESLSSADYPPVKADAQNSLEYHKLVLIFNTL